MIFARLSKPQKRALIAINIRGGLLRSQAGWEGTYIHRQSTVMALQRAGLCRFNLRSMGAVMPTKRGRRVVTDTVGDVNACIAWIDADRMNKRVEANR